MGRSPVEGVAEALRGETLFLHRISAVRVYVYIAKTTILRAGIRGIPHMVTIEKTWGNYHFAQILLTTAPCENLVITGFQEFMTRATHIPGWF